MGSKHPISLRLKLKNHWNNTSYYFNSINEQYNSQFTLISWIFLTSYIYLDFSDSILIY
jgi:hypothetical protein